MRCVTGAGELLQEGSDDEEEDEEEEEEMEVERGASLSFSKGRGQGREEGHLESSKKRTRRESMDGKLLNGRTLAAPGAGVVAGR
jgi:hypothetical protein